MVALAPPMTPRNVVFVYQHLLIPGVSFQSVPRRTSSRSKFGSGRVSGLNQMLPICTLAYAGSKHTE
ncbi:hypothetical protein AG1IA_05933 [Rhizoctonia solani AG-1 IA]|uniref:Uncharacterized protein n=1 Tax=Thanatephorus cucumeris (strain AG1-IA) TaxID=983506 RepID=L8WPE9_THACA|nr:hypothetical protein AG1IA_05933 [Rhizoctonia solani AG-1 IA]